MLLITLLATSTLHIAASNITVLIKIRSLHI